MCPHLNKASSNGLAESAVRSAKLLMKKVEISGHNLKIMLYYCNNTPRSCGLSPDELLLQRHVRTALPQLDSNINIGKAEELRQESVEKRLSNSMYLGMKDILAIGD